MIGKKIGNHHACGDWGDGMTQYDAVHHMDTLFPALSRSFSELVWNLARSSAAIGGQLHPITRGGVATLLRNMNSYYSNLIEDHNTHPADIERALRHDYVQDPGRRALQIESAAHIEVQSLIDVRLRQEPNLDVCDPQFLSWIHAEFYQRMPDEFMRIDFNGQTYKVLPGAFRDVEVAVGRHLAPTHTAVAPLLRRFAEAYRIESLSPEKQVLAAAASHHRLLWIHPFLDGNGRVARLFTHAYMSRIGLDGHGLWSVVRGLARRRDQYRAALAHADSSRQGDYDGRGNLSERGLSEFCAFFLGTALDQTAFMGELLNMDGLLARIEDFISRLAGRGETRSAAYYLIREALLRGEYARGEAARITGLSERSARTLLGELLSPGLGLLQSDSPKGRVRMGFPIHAVGYYFPRLYPEGAES